MSPRLLVTPPTQSIQPTITQTVMETCTTTVSYTHLDVYKRQVMFSSMFFAPLDFYAFLRIYD